MSSSFGEAIRAIRRQKPRWTQTTLAQKAGVNLDTIVRIERGGEIKQTTARKVVEALKEKLDADRLQAYLHQFYLGQDFSHVPSTPGVSGGPGTGTSSGLEDTRMAEYLKDPLITKLVAMVGDLPRTDQEDIYDYALRREIKRRTDRLKNRPA